MVFARKDDWWEDHRTFTSFDVEQLKGRIMKRTLEDYSLDEINQALYGNKMLKNLWKDEERETKQLFVKHSNSDLDMFRVPLFWIPIIKKLMKELIGIDSNICFLQIKERFGKLEIRTKAFKLAYCNTIYQSLESAKTAVNTITLIQLGLFDELKINTTRII